MGTINIIKPDAKSVGAGLLANAVGQLPLQAQTDCFASKRAPTACSAVMNVMIVPTLRVGMHPLTLCVRNTTRSVASGVTTRSVGTIVGVTRNRFTHS